jgi:nicotinamide-nucleotide amidase
MNSATIAIGTELTTGAKVDTNSQWLSVELAAIGAPVLVHLTVADDLSANIDAMRYAAERTDVVIITGGLGPTLDDLTREAMASLLGVSLELHEPTLAVIREMFASRKREMPGRNRVQALFPAGSEPIANPRGTAPGIACEYRRADGGVCRLFALPGVPSEMKPMFTESVVPALIASGAGGKVIRTRRLNAFGLGESAAEEMLGGITARGRDPEVGITVHQATITLRIVAESESTAAAQSKLDETAALIRERLGEYVFGEDDVELADVVVARLKQLGRTVKVFEAGSAGLITQWLCERDPVGSVFRGGAVGYATFGDARSAAEVVSAAVEEGAECVVAAGPIRPGEKPGDAPIADVAAGSDGQVQQVQLTMLGDPTINRSRLAKTGLDILRRQLLQR